MDAVEFMKEWQRMCDVTDCDDCSIKKECKCGTERFHPYYIREFENIVSVVEQWGKEHPRKTRANDFWEKHPNAKIESNFYTEFCCETLGYCEKCDHNYNASYCKDCWSESI